MFLQAAAMMEEQAHIVVVGGKLDGDRELQNLQKLAVDYNISHRVHFWGARPPRRIAHNL